nr:MAG TPA: hypothetical protein [Caudoviricetes sp.]
MFICTFAPQSAFFIIKKNIIMQEKAYHLPWYAFLFLLLYFPISLPLHTSPLLSHNLPCLSP